MRIFSIKLKQPNNADKDILTFLQYQKKKLKIKNGYERIIKNYLICFKFMDQNGPRFLNFFKESNRY